MTKFKDVIETVCEVIYDMATFKSCTIFERWFEITCGIMFWMYIIIMIYILIW